MREVLDTYTAMRFYAGICVMGLTTGSMIRIPALPVLILTRYIKP